MDASEPFHRTHFLYSCPLAYLIVTIKLLLSLFKALHSRESSSLFDVLYVFDFLALDLQRPGYKIIVNEFFRLQAFTPESLTTLTTFKSKKRNAHFL